MDTKGDALVKTVAALLPGDPLVLAAGTDSFGALLSENFFFRAAAEVATSPSGVESS
jgi:hypothetical protein